MTDKKKTKFIRKNGKVIPIRGDGGADLRSSPKYDKKITTSIFKKHGKERKLKEKFKLATGLSIGLGSVGLLGGSVFDIARGGKNFKGTKAGILSGVGLGLLAGLTDKSKVVSNRKYNKEFGKAYAKKKK